METGCKGSVSLSQTMSYAFLCSLLPGDRPTRRWEVCFADGDCQSAEGEGKTRVHPSGSPTCLQNPRRPGLPRRDVCGFPWSEWGPAWGCHPWIWGGLHPAPPQWPRAQALGRARQERRQHGAEGWALWWLHVPSIVQAQRLGDRPLCARHGPVWFLLCSRLGAPARWLPGDGAYGHGAGASVHPGGHLYSQLHYLHVFLRLHLPWGWLLPQLCSCPPQGQQQQRAFLWLAQLTHAAGPVSVQRREAVGVHVATAWVGSLQRGETRLPSRVPVDLGRTLSVRETHQAVGLKDLQTSIPVWTQVLTSSGDVAKRMECVLFPVTHLRAGS